MVGRRGERRAISAAEHTQKSATSPPGAEATAQVWVTGRKGEVVEELPERTEVPLVAGEGLINPLWFMHGKILPEVQCERDGERCLDMSRSLAPIHFAVMGDLWNRMKDPCCSTRIYLGTL